MTGSLERLIETALAALIDAESTAIQCVENMLAGGESAAVLPRVVIKCESQESPDFQETTDGIWGVYPVQTTVACMAEATHPLSSDHMEEMTTAVDAVLVYNGGLAEALTSGSLRVFGVVPSGIQQDREGNKIIRHRSILIWARIQPVVSSEGIVTEADEQVLTEDSIPIFTE